MLAALARRRWDWRGARTPAGHSASTAALARSWRWIEVMRQRHRQRRALAALDERLLRDIGIDRTQAEAEANKPFWRH